MKKSEVEAGMVVLMKVSGKVVPCRIDRIDEGTTWRGKAETIYRLTNTITGRSCQARSASKFRGEVKPKKVDNRYAEDGFSILCDHLMKSQEPSLKS